MYNTTRDLNMKVDRMKKEVIKAFEISQNNNTEFSNRMRFEYARFLTEFEKKHYEVCETLRELKEQIKIERTIVKVKLRRAEERLNHPISKNCKAELSNECYMLSKELEWLDVFEKFVFDTDYIK